MVVCKNCKKEIDKKASICPRCGVRVHPIKDILKMVTIILVVILVLVFGLYVFSGGLSRTIENAKKEAPAKKFYGTWELVSKNGNAENYEIDKTTKITGINNFHSWYIEDKDYIAVLVGDGVACFRIDDDYLIQEDCGDFSVGEYNLKDTGLKYKRIK